MHIPHHLNTYITRREDEARIAHVALRLVHDLLVAGRIESAKERAAEALAEIHAVTRVPTNPATLLATGALGSEQEA